MAVTIVVSFLLFIPIEWIIQILALPSGMMIGYYANQRSDRRAGPWSRILINGVFAGLVTGLTAAVLLVLIKGIFFYADSGFRGPGQGGQITCQTGAECVYQRYLEAGRGPELAAAGVHDAGSFTRLLLAGAVRDGRDAGAVDDARCARRRCDLRGGATEDAHSGAGPSRVSAPEGRRGVALRATTHHGHAPDVGLAPGVLAARRRASSDACTARTSTTDGRAALEIREDGPHRASDARSTATGD